MIHGSEGELGGRAEPGARALGEGAPTVHNGEVTTWANGGRETPTRESPGSLGIREVGGYSGISGLAVSLQTWGAD